MNNTLTSFKFNDLLPSSVKDDAKFVAASACLDKLFENFDERIKSMLVYSRIDELSEAELNDLAWQWNVGYYEGWTLAETLAEKRAMIKQAIQIHWHKGTRWALERVGEMLNMPVRVIEWHEREGISDNLEPYEFNCYVDASVKGVRDDFYIIATDLVNNIKNVRSYMKRIQAMIAISVSQNMGVLGHSVIAGRVDPEIWRGEAREYQIGFGAFCQITFISRVLPDVFLGASIDCQIPVGANCQMVFVSRVEPETSRFTEKSFESFIGICGH